MTAPLVSIRNLTKRFAVRSGLFARTAHVHAVDDVSFDIGQGEVVGLVGESGSGKTTLGRALLRLIEPSAGQVRYRDIDVTRASAGALRDLRREMQIVFQDPFATLDPRRTILAQVQEPFVIHGLHSPAERRQLALDLLGRVGINPEQADRLPHEFSGGQRQRISIARAIALNPNFLVADEAVSALDVSIQAQIVNLLMDLREEMNLTMLFISHDLSVVEFVSDRVVVMYLGRVVEIGPSGALFRNPRHPYTRALIAAIPVPDPQQRQAMQTLPGDIPSPLAPPSGCAFRTRCAFAQPACAQTRPVLRDVGGGQQAACLRDDVVLNA